MSSNDFKSDIQVWAVKHRWLMHQIQYAEDYIKSLYKKGIDAKPPRGLDTEKADYIKDAFLKKSD